MTSPVGQSNRPLIIAVVVGLLAIGGIFVFTAQQQQPPRADCVKLEVSSSTEKDDLLADLARGYNDAGRDFGGRCAVVAVHGLTSGKGMAALDKGWAAADTKQPEPQVWLPSTSLWLTWLAAKGKASVAVSLDNPSIMSSPMTVAMPSMMADAFLAKHPDPGWNDILQLAIDPGGWASLGHPEWGEFRLGRDHPELSSSGLGASIATFHAGSVANGYPGVTAQSVDDTRVLKFVHGVESSVARYTKDASEFIDVLAAEDAKKPDVPHISAIVMQEQLAYDYNRRGTNTKFKTIYPKDGALVFDHPYIVTASATADQRAAAADFLAYLGEDAQRAKLRAAGFRDRSQSTVPTEELRRELSISDSQRISAIPPPSPELVEKIVGLWNGTRRNARVLLVLDTSGSMGKGADPNDPDLDGKTRLKQVSEAASRAIDLLSKEDDVGLWTFSSPGHVERVPIGKLKNVRSTFDLTLANLPASGDTDLYATVSAAYDAMAATADPDRINAIVVLSDGEDTTGAPGAKEALLQKIEQGTKERPMPVFTISYGEANPETMKQIAAASKAPHYDAKDPKNTDEVFKAVFQNL